MARYQGTPLPAVELIQIDEVYFVVDGHYRISVAKALGEWAIDSVVAAWDIERPRTVVGEPAKDLRQELLAAIRQYKE